MKTEEVAIRYEYSVQFGKNNVCAMRNPKGEIILEGTHDRFALLALGGRGLCLGAEKT